MVRVTPCDAFTSATTANTARMANSVPSKMTCERADSSMPFQQIQHIARMNRMPMMVCSQMFEAVFSSKNSSSRYCPDTPARLGMITRSATMQPHPAIQPVFGPNARTPQVKLVPQSGSALLR